MMLTVMMMIVGWHSDHYDGDRIHYDMMVIEFAGGIMLMTAMILLLG